jgi:hypothetical protein
MFEQPDGTEADPATASGSELPDASEPDTTTAAAAAASDAEAEAAPEAADKAVQPSTFEAAEAAEAVPLQSNGQPRGQSKKKKKRGRSPSSASKASRKKVTRVRIDEFPVASQLICSLMPLLRQELMGSDTLRERLFQVNFHTTLSKQGLITMAYHKQVRNRLQVMKQLVTGMYEWLTTAPARLQTLCHNLPPGSPAFIHRAERSCSSAAGMTLSGSTLPPGNTTCLQRSELSSSAASLTPSVPATRRKPIARCAA